MELVNTITAFLAKLFQWWFTVMPWEQAIRVRRGRESKLLGAGLYLKIPFIDSVYIQTTRMRMIDTPMQTMSTKDGSTITIKTAVGYTIADVEKLYSTLYHPEMTLNSMAMGCIGEYVRSNNLLDISPSLVESYVNGKITGSDYGLSGLSIKITTFAAVKTFRLIQDSSGLYEGLQMEKIK